MHVNASKSKLKLKILIYIQKIFQNAKKFSFNLKY